MREGTYLVPPLWGHFNGYLFGRSTCTGTFSLLYHAGFAGQLLFKCDDVELSVGTI